MKATLRSALLITLCFGLAGYTQADEPPRLNVSLRLRLAAALT
ncbi:hypothetical protein UMZ34_08255 [Halopseudomonas pachastrellae]|nr:hypothetical protein UMZ34_08255 [Halopseudomonas pachastrellae]